MKKLIYSVLAVVLMFSCTMQPKFEINGNIEGLNAESAVLKKIVDNKWVTVDSVSVKNGMFTLNGSVDYPEFHVIVFNDTLDAVRLFVENSEITVNGNVNEIGEVEILGSELSLKYNEFDEQLLSYNTQFSALYNEYIQANMSQDVEKIKEIEQKYQDVENQQNDYIKQFIKDNSDNVVGPFITMNYLYSKLPVEELSEVVNGFSEELAENQNVIALKERISVLERVAIGQPYVDFTMNDPEGNPVSLSSYIGDKYVLLDFWAAWCNPCRQENPNLVAEYAKYKDKGFEIFGVSFDKTKEAWLKAVEQDGITWPQVSDLAYWNNEAGKLYAVSSIPHNVLIDKDGIIIAKNLRGEELGKKLEELLD